jgi:hypothetical protein
MPNHLEYVTRPSESPNIRPGHPTQILAAQKIVANNPITWGSPGNSVFDLRASSQATVPLPKFESQRTYDVVRVFNPDDKTQFVDTEQMTEYQGRNKIADDRISLQFATNTNTDNTQVISKGNVRKSQIPQ